MIDTNKILSISDKKYTIRQGNLSDYDFCYNLCKRNMEAYYIRFSNGWNSRLFRESFDPMTIWIVEYLNKRIGFFNIEFSKKFSYIVDLQVSTKYRDKGLGTILLKFMEQQTKDKGLKKVCLEVFKTNTIAKFFYLSSGYKKKENRGSTIIMEKKISK